MNSVFTSIIYFAAYPFLLVILFFRVNKIKSKAKKYEKDEKSVLIQDRYKMVYKAAKTLLFLKRVKANFENFDNLPRKPLLYIANHKSQVDPVLIFKIIYEHEEYPFVTFVAKKELNDSKTMQAVLKLIDCVLIERENPRQVYEAYTEENRLLKSGRSLCVFIEGTRIASHDFGDFKPAVLKAAYQNLCPIVPIVIYGSLGVMDTKNNVKSKDFMKKIDVVCKKIIKPSEYVNIKTETVTNRLKDEMFDHYHKLHQKSLKNKK